MPDIAWLLIGIAVVGAIYVFGVRGILMPHAFAQRLKVRERLGREPFPGELTRTQNFYFTLASYSEMYPTLFGMDHYSSFGGGGDDGGFADCEDSSGGGGDSGGDGGSTA